MAVGSRVVQARQEAGLTTKALAERLDLSLWAAERLERGELDARPYLDAVAEATGRSTTFFREDDLTVGAEAAAEVAGSSAVHAGAGSARVPEASSLEGRSLILASLVAMVVVRFFTEVVAVLPRAATFIDIPIFFVLALVALSQPRSAERAAARRRPYGALALGLLVVSIVSVLLNSARVDLGPALFFLYGFLSPIGLYAAVHVLWPPGGALLVSRVLVGLAVVQILVAYSIQVPRFLATENPDVVSGTFGENAYQLVFFLVVMIALLAAIYTFEKRRLVARFIPLLMVAIIVIILLAQFRALLVTIGLTLVLLGVLLGGRNPRGAIAAIVALMALVVTLTFVVQNVPFLKFGSTVDEVRSDPTSYFEQRLRVARSVRSLYGDDMRYIVTGTGPGTYSSRAWRTFALDATRSDSAVSSPARLLTGGRGYSTDVSEKYVTPNLGKDSAVVSGSRAVNSPYSSYLSLLAEVGVFGFIVLIGAYLAAFVAALRMTRRAMRSALPGDPLPALLCACTVAFFVLPQMALLENWLEVTRVTFLSWMLLAIATKEFDARERTETA